MGINASNIRREGRRAYCYDDDPNEVCPYKADGHLRRTWMEGWYDEEQQEDYRRAQEDAFHANEI